MPCYTVRWVTVEFQGRDVDLLMKAIEEVGGLAYGAENIRALAESIIRTGRVRTRDEALVTRLKQAYSKQVIFKTARQGGFQVRKTGQFAYQLERR